MPEQRLPLLSDQRDRLAIQQWVEREGFGVEPRMLGGAFVLTGALDVPVLERSIQLLVDRHEALRVSVPDRGTGGYQLVSSAPQVTLATEDIRRPEADPEALRAEAVRRVGDRITANLDLAGGLLLAAKLVRCQDDEYVFGVGIDHLTTDGESFDLLMKELWHCYERLTTGRQPELPEQPFTYSDLVRWEARWLTESSEPPELIAGFREDLAGIGPNPPLVLRGQLRETNANYRIGRVNGTLPAQASASLSEYCRGARVSPFATLLSAYFCAISGNNGRTDLGSMIPVTRRTEEHLLQLVAFTSTYATTRVTLDPAMSFRDLTRRARSSVLRTLRLGRLPAPEVTRALAPHMLGRLLERPSSFFDLSAWQWRGGQAVGAELTVRPVAVPSPDGQIESVEMFASLGPEGIEYEIVFPEEVYPHSEIEGVARTFEALTAAGVSAPERSIAELLTESPPTTDTSAVVGTGNS